MYFSCCGERFSCLHRMRSLARYGSICSFLSYSQLKQVQEEMSLLNWRKWRLRRWRVLAKPPPLQEIGMLREESIVRWTKKIYRLRRQAEKQRLIDLPSLLERRYLALVALRVGLRPVACEAFLGLTQSGGLTARWLRLANTSLTRRAVESC